MRTTQEGLQAVRDHLLTHGWCQSKGYDDNNHNIMCLSYALAYCVDSSYEWRGLVEEMTRRLNVLGIFEGYNSWICTTEPIVTFNDDPNTDFDTVLTFLSDKWETLRCR